MKREDIIKPENKVYSRPRLLDKNVMHYCPGCSHGVVHKLVAEVIEELGLEEDAIGIAPVGCSVFAYNYIDCDWIEAAHGRAPALATAVSRLHPSKVVFTYQGDGDLAAIGSAETIHDYNGIYGMTGGQMSPCTLEGAKTATTPYGRRTDLNGFPLRVANMVSLLDGTCYVTRQAVHTTAAVRKAKAAIRKAFLNARGKMGTSFVEVVATCSSGWKMSPAKSNQWMVDNMFAHYPLGDIKDTTVPAENAK